jgi:23S rRNA (pseudouridine1915-N3)-methyltransferase
MEIRLLAVGKLRPALRVAADDYLRRLRRYAEVTEVEVREAGTAPTVAEGRRQEGARLRERLLPGSHLVALDREGRGWSSEELARHLDRWRLASRSVTLLIGGSHGLEPALAADSDQRWSLGPITLPHQLARVVVTEQLYRAWTILRGEPYHK